MGRLDGISRDRAVAAFQALGWGIARDRKGHTIMKKAGHRNHLSIPNHKTLKAGLLRSLISAAGVTVDEFLAAL